MRVSVVTDSTAYLPREVVAESGIRVVPVQVVLGDESFDETEDPDGVRVTAALRAWSPVTTSRPSPERFAETFRAAAADGADAVVCATLSSAMSATHESALLAAKGSPIPVTVIDSRSVAMGLGYAVIRGAALARSGADAAAVADAIARCSAATTVLFYVDTLEYLRRGGRIGAARALLGQALQVKPILHLSDGVVAPLERVRTAGRALARIEDLVVARAGPGADVAVQDLGAEQRAIDLAGSIAGRRPDLRPIRCPVGAVVGAHTGPGLVAVVVAPVADER